MFKKSFFVLAIVFFAVFVSYAQVPQLINYQGMLNDVSGTALSGSYSIEFKIHSAATGGSNLWSETQTVTVADGLFDVLLGSVTPIPYSVFDGSDKYLSLKVGSDSEMTPRKRLVSVGNSFRAYNADKVDGKDASDFVQVNQTNSISTAMIKNGAVTTDKIQNNAVTTAKISPDIVSSIDGVKNDGRDIDLVAGNNITITPDDANNKITIAAAGSGGGDNLGNHTATQNVKLDGHWLSGDGENEGVSINNAGEVGMGTSNPDAQLHVETHRRYAGYFTSDSMSNDTHVIHAEVKGSSTSFSPIAIYGRSLLGDGLGIGGSFLGGHVGVQGSVPPMGSNEYEYIGVKGFVEGGSSKNKGVYGRSNGTGENIGVYGYAQGFTSASTSYGVYGKVDGTGAQWAGYFDGNLFTKGFEMPIGAANSYVLTSDANGVGTWKQPSSGADNLGNHTATQNINLNGQWLSGDGGNEGIFISNDGNIGVGTNTNLYSTFSVDGSISSNIVYTSHLKASQGNDSDVPPISVWGPGNEIHIGLLDACLRAYSTFDEVQYANIATLATNSYAVSGLNRDGDANSFGYLGGDTYGAYGRHFNGSYGGLGGFKAAVLGHASDSNWAGYFEGNLYTEGFKMPTGAANGYVLTSDADGVGTWQAFSGGDNLGNHTATQNIKLNGKWLSGDGQDEGIRVDSYGDVWIGDNVDPAADTRDLNVDGTIIAGNALKANGFKAPFGVEGSGTHAGILGNGPIGVQGSGSDIGIYGESGGKYAGKFETGYESDDTHVVHAEFTGTDKNAIAVYGKSAPKDLRGYGGYFEGGHRGVMGIVNSAGPGAFGATYTGVYGDVQAATGTVHGVSGNAYGGSTNKGLYGTAGSGTSSFGVHGFASGGSTNNYGVYGYASGSSGTKYGVYGGAFGAPGTFWAGYFDGNVRITGTLNPSLGVSQMDHPLDPANKYLNHAFVESSEMMNIYNGNAVLNANGEATVELPEWFQALNKDFRYQLTCIGGFAQIFIAEEINNNQFKIAGGKPGMKISWQITGIRKDAYANAHRMQVEEEKQGEERGKYLHAMEHGVSEELGINYEQRQENLKNIEK